MKQTVGSAAPSAVEVLDYLKTRQGDMIGMLEALTLAESPSDKPETQARVRELIAERLEAEDYRTYRIPGRRSGGCLYARPAGRRRGGPVQMMLGHYDTVWPLGTLAEIPFEVDGNIVRGPGVFDMKGGIVQMVLAVAALRHFDLEPEVAPVVFVNSDEEIGSRDSTAHIRRLAAHMNRVFVLEPSLGPEGRLKTARKGVGRFMVTVKGKAAHAGLDPEAGASAILELSHVIQQLFALNDPEKGITVNVGTIEGGMRPNVIAPESSAVIDVRVKTQTDAERIEAAIHGLKPSTPQTSLEIEGGIGRPALEPTPRNRELWHVARQLGQSLGIELEEGLAGGGSDGNTTSLFTATLDGLGAVGDGAHALHEFLYIDKTIERAALLTLLLLQPPLETDPLAEPGAGQ